MIKEKLMSKFGNHINHMSCIYLRDGETRLRSFLDGKKFNTIIEIGTYQGVSAAVLSEYADKVYTFDIKKQELTDKIIEYLKIKNINSIIMSPSSIKKYIKDLFINQKIDLCFIDGEHFNGELKKDYEMCKECDNILIHDYSESFPEIYDFINSLKGYEKTVNDTFVLLRRSVKSKKTEKPEKKIKKEKKAKTKNKRKPKS
jgi:hypothetical protein